MSTFDFRCPNCLHVEEIKGSVGVALSPKCPKCQSEMKRYFASMGPVNYGFREHKYGNETDRNIAKFQFENL